MRVDTRDAPDIVLFAIDWRARALIRAQLIEDGFDVLATDTWREARRWLRHSSTPRAVIVDVTDVKHPMDLLEGLRELTRPDRVIVLTGLGALPPAPIEGLGFRVLKRPFAIGDVSAAVRGALS